jgi:hypothetical protein
VAPDNRSQPSTATQTPTHVLAGRLKPLAGGAAKSVRALGRDALAGIVANAVEQRPDGFAFRLLYRNLVDELDTRVVRR